MSAGRDLPSANVSNSRGVEEEDGILLETPVRIEGDSLTSLLPSIKAIVTAYAELKSDQLWGKVKLTDIPLNKLIAPSVKSEQAIREVIKSLKENEQALAHGAVKRLKEIFGDASASSADSKEEKTAGQILLTAFYQQAQRYLAGFLELPVRAVSAAVQSFLGVSVQEQKKIIYELTSAASGGTKAQHIVEIIDICIQAKDCKGSETEYDKLIERIREVETIHVPPALHDKDLPGWSNIKRGILGRKEFENVFFLFCENAILLVGNIKKSKLASVEGSVERKGSVPSPSVSLASSPDEKKEENVRLLAELKRANDLLAEEKKSSREKEEKLQKVIREIKCSHDEKLALATKEIQVRHEEELKLNALVQTSQEKENKLEQEIKDIKRSHEDKLRADVKAHHDLEEGLKFSNTKLSTLTQNIQDAQECSSHAIKLTDSKNKCFFLFTVTSSGAGLCWLLGVGVSAWWLIPLGLFLGGVYYAYDSYKERSQVAMLETQVTLGKKTILEESTKFLTLKLKSQEQKRPHPLVEGQPAEGKLSEEKSKDQAQERLAQLSLLDDPFAKSKSSLDHLGDLLKSPIIISAPQKIQQEIYDIFQRAINTLQLNSITEEAIRVQVHRSCETLVPKIQRNTPWFFGKKQYQEIEGVVAELKENVRPR